MAVGVFAERCAQIEFLKISDGIAFGEKQKLSPFVIRFPEGFVEGWKGFFKPYPELRWREIVQNLIAVVVGSMLEIFDDAFLLKLHPGENDQRRKSVWRSEEHTSELQSLMRKSYADFRLT